LMRSAGAMAGAGIAQRKLGRAGCVWADERASSLCAWRGKGIGWQGQTRPRGRHDVHPAGHNLVHRNSKSASAFSASNYRIYFTSSDLHGRIFQIHFRYALQCTLRFNDL
jgi:hypothetical protein